MHRFVVVESTGRFERRRAMPRGTVKWFDPRTREARIVHAGREYPARADDIETAARMAGVHVDFDISRDAAVDRAVNVTIAPGTRTSHLQHRHGDLVGAHDPRAAGAAPLSRSQRDRPEHDTQTPAGEIAVAWLREVRSGRLGNALRLYAPDAVVHMWTRNVQGRDHIAAELERCPLFDAADVSTEVRDEGTEAIVRWDRSLRAPSGGEIRLRITAGEIVEQWLPGP
jgi:hypothetical protein